MVRCKPGISVSNEPDWDNSIFVDGNLPPNTIVIDDMDLGCKPNRSVDDPVSSLEGYWDRDDISGTLYPKQLSDKVMVGKTAQSYDEVFGVVGKVYSSAGYMLGPGTQLVYAPNSTTMGIYVQDRDSLYIGRGYVRGAQSSAPLINTVDATNAAATPPYTFNGDTNTGMYRHEANGLSFSGGGSDLFVLNADGSVQLPNLPDTAADATVPVLARNAATGLIEQRVLTELHSHTNKSVLDLISDIGGALGYDSLLVFDPSPYYTSLEVDALDAILLANINTRSLITHNHNLADLAERSYNSLTGLPDLSELHTHANFPTLERIPDYTTASDGDIIERAGAGMQWIAKSSLQFWQRVTGLITPLTTSDNVGVYGNFYLNTSSGSSHVDRFIYWGDVADWDTGLYESADDVLHIFAGGSDIVDITTGNVTFHQALKPFTDHTASVGISTYYFNSSYIANMNILHVAGTDASSINNDSSDNLHVYPGAGTTYFDAPSLDNIVRVNDNTGGATYFRVSGSGALFTDATDMTFQDGTTGPHTLTALLAGAGSVTFIGLTDTPTDWTGGVEGFMVMVNSTPDGVEFIDPSSYPIDNFSGTLAGGTFTILGSPTNHLQIDHAHGSIGSTRMEFYTGQSINFTAYTNTNFTGNGSTINVDQQYASVRVEFGANEKSIVVDGTSMLIKDTNNSTGFEYFADYSTAGKAVGARWVPDWGAVTSQLGGNDVHTTITSPGAGEDGYLVFWDNTNSRYDLTVPGGGGMVYPGAGIALSTGAAWSASIPNNSSNWDTAYGWGDHSGLYANSSHTHGNISNAGAIGSTANLPIITTTSGVLIAGSFGTGANTFCVGNDSRLSDARTPVSHALDSATYHSISDTTVFNATTSAHGFLKKLSNVATEYMNGLGNWATPPGSSISFGTSNQVPHMNSVGTDFDYSAKYTFDGTTLLVSTTLNETIRVKVDSSSSGTSARADLYAEAYTPSGQNSIGVIQFGSGSSTTVFGQAASKAAVIYAGGTDPSRLMIGISSAASLILATANTKRLEVSSTGNYFMWHNSDVSERLTIDMGVDDYASIFHYDSSPAGFKTLRLGTNVTTTSLLIDGNTGYVGVGVAPSTYNFRVLGTIYASGDIYGNSDIRYKEVLGVVPFKWDDFMSITPIRYKSKLDNGEATFGFSAQEMMQHWNEPVSYDSVTERYAMKYNAIIPINTMAIQKLKTETDLLKERVKELEDEVALLQQTL